MPTTSELVTVPPGLDKLVDAFRRNEIDLSADGPGSDMARGGKIVHDVTLAIYGLSGRHGFPVVLKDAAFRAGSFGRRTQARPLDDVDIFIPLDAAFVTMNGPGGSPTRESPVTLSDESPLGCDPLLRNGPWLDSSLVLDKAVEALCNHLQLPGMSDCGKNRRGRCAHLTYMGVNVDLVFVLWAEHPSIDRYLLPEGNGSWRWKASNPKDDQTRLTEANKRHNGNLLPVIRCLKAWNDHACAGRLKSVHLEVLLAETVFGAASGVTIDSRVGAIAYALEELPNALAVECADPTGLGPALDSSLDPEDREWVREKARHSAEEFQRALRDGHADIEKATTEVRRILMTKGPEAPERTRETHELRHDSTFGQPAHDCSDGDRARRASVAVPPPRKEDRPPLVSDQRDRPGHYG